MSDTLCYEARYTGNGMKYHLVYPEPELFHQMTGQCLTTTTRSTFPNLREGVRNAMLIYNVPSSALDRCQGKTLKVRSDNAAALAEAFSIVPQENLLHLQVLSMDADPDSLLHLSDPMPIDLVIDHPAEEFSRLYRFAELTGKHPVRMTVQAAPGMMKAVNIAQALNFSVKLEVNQPDAPIVNELIALAEYYLRGATVSRPIEPLHSLFLSFFSGSPTSLWKLQEEDPAVDRYVTDDRSIAFSRRLVSLGIPEDQFPGFRELHMSDCVERQGCAQCEFFSRCEGYFKLPDKGYECDQIKQLFSTLNDAAKEMKQDEQRYLELYGQPNANLDAGR